MAESSDVVSILARVYLQTMPDTDNISTLQICGKYQLDSEVIIYKSPAIGDVLVCR